MTGVDFEWDFKDAGPLPDLNSALPHFRRPFAPAAVRWKVQSAWEGGGLVVAYIDARLVIERLNLVVGAEWDDAYKPHSQGVEECALTVFDRTRRDVGTGSGPQAAKGARSDSFKRAGVKFGIGVSIYALKSVMMDATGGNTPTDKALLIKNKKKQGQKTTWSAQLSVQAERYLATIYDRWLNETEGGRTPGSALFGPALDHGDEAGAAGLEAEEQQPETVAAEAQEEVGPKLEDERAEQLRAQITEVYAEMRTLDARKIPPAAHRAALKQAEHSHDALEALLADYTAKLGEMKGAKG